MNLADAKQRPVAQSAKIGNRAGILPERRDTRQPALEVNASMRTARRGDSGAQELMRALGLVQHAGEELASYVGEKHAADEQDNIARGLVDQQAGTVDEAQMERSLGYRNAVTKGRTVNEFARASREFDEELHGLIERQDDPDLEVRKAEVSERIEAFYRDFAVDPETGGVKRAFQSPGALRYLAETMQASRASFAANAQARIEERFNKEAVGHYGQFVGDQIDANVLPDLDAARALLPATVTDERIAEATFTAISNGVDRLAAAGRFEDAARLLASARGFASKPLESLTPEPQPAGAVSPKTGRVSFDALAGAVEWQESRGNPGAVSPKGAVGRMQTMPATLRDPGFGVKPAKDESDEERTRVGRDYLRAMLRRYDGDYVRALAAYNGGPGNVDEWNLTGNTRQKIAAIPFKETREYVSSVLGRVGVVEGDSATAPDDPVKATPGFRLAAPGADPVTRFEQTGAVTPIKGLDGIQFSPEQQARLNALYEQRTSDLRRLWSQKRDDDQANNASSMLLRLYGQGEPLSSVEITSAIRREEISPQQGVTLFNVLRQNANAVQAYEDRQLTLGDRAEAKRQKEEAATISGRYISDVLSGRMTSGQARQRLLEELPRIKDPVVQATVANSVLGTAGDIEQLRANSEPVRNTLREIDDLEETTVDLLGKSYSGRRNVPRANSLLDQARAEFATRVRDGEDPAAARAAVSNKYIPKLQALVPAARK